MNLRIENAAEFLFLLDQKLKSIPNKMSANDLVCQIPQTIMQCVDRFAPGKESFISQNQNDWMNKIQNDWMNNKIKHAINESDKLIPRSIYNSPKLTKIQQQTTMALPHLECLNNFFV